MSAKHGITAVAGANKRLHLEVAADLGDDEISEEISTHPFVRSIIRNQRSQAEAD